MLVMQKKRLLKLARFLREYVRDRWFKLDHWAEKGFKEKQCGTTACGLGWATVCFPRSGLKLDDLENWENFHNVIYKVGDKEYTDFKAGQKFFGLTPEQSSYLFDPYCYRPDHRGRRSVASRIEKLVENNGKLSDKMLKKIRG
jgi:hypothetical protein